MLNIESSICSASELLIKKVFGLSYSNVTGGKCSDILCNSKGVYWYLYTIKHGAVELQVYIGFASTSFSVFMDTAYYGLKQIKNEIDYDLLYTNIAGMILCKLHNDLRDNEKELTYSLNEKKMKIIPYNTINMLFLGKKDADTILYIGYHSM